MRERDGLIEANSMLLKERNDLAEKLNFHRRNLDSAIAETESVKVEKEVLAKKQEA